jgi:hypothetical protein
VNTAAPQPDVDQITASGLACRDIAELHGGRFGEAATYLPGRRVTGIRVTPTEIFVHVVARCSAPMRQIEDAVRCAVTSQSAGLPVTPVIEDLVVDDPDPPPSDHRKETPS